MVFQPMVIPCITDLLVNPQFREFWGEFSNQWSCVSRTFSPWNWGRGGLPLEFHLPFSGRNTRCMKSGTPYSISRDDQLPPGQRFERAEGFHAPAHPARPWSRRPLCAGQSAQGPAAALGWADAEGRTKWGGRFGPSESSGVLVFFWGGSLVGVSI